MSREQLQTTFAHSATASTLAPLRTARSRWRSTNLRSSLAATPQRFMDSAVRRCESSRERSNSRVLHRLRRLLPFALLLVGGLAQAASLERTLNLKITIAGTQNWRNVLQSSQATTTQDYTLSTSLRSDGIRYADNLLDPDVTHRLEVKQDYLTRQGLLRLKQENGGKLPTTPVDLKAFTDRVQQAGTPCREESDCDWAVAERYAALSALQNNSVQTLEEFLQPPVNADGSGYYYFFGYGGCSNRMHLVNHTHIAGRRAYERDRKQLQPFVLDRSADSTGSATEQASLCRRYTITIDAKTGALFVENTYLPEAHGTTVKSLSGRTESSETDMPVPAEVISWVTQTLRQAKSVSGSTATQLHITAPLDGDSTVLGEFNGVLEVHLDWSFLAATAPPAKP